VGRAATPEEQAAMIAVGWTGIKAEYGLTERTSCSNGDSGALDLRQCFDTSDPRAMVGTNAGTLHGLKGQGPGLFFDSECWLFLFKDSKGWHYLNARCTVYPGQVPGAVDHVFVDGCANYRAAPSLSAKVYGCLPNGTVVYINSAPVYSDGHIWWHLAAFEGWMAHDFLIVAKSA
jgi:hypothetical protein